MARKTRHCHPKRDVSASQWHPSSYFLGQPLTDDCPIHCISTTPQSQMSEFSKLQQFILIDHLASSFVSNYESFDLGTSTGISLRWQCVVTFALNHTSTHLVQRKADIGWGAVQRRALTFLCKQCSYLTAAREKMAQHSFELQEAVERRGEKRTPDGAAILNIFKRTFFKPL